MRVVLGDLHGAHRACNEGSLIRRTLDASSDHNEMAALVGEGEEADTMTSDTRPPYKEIIHDDAFATNYQASRNKALSEDADTDVEGPSYARCLKNTESMLVTLGVKIINPAADRGFFIFF